MPNTDTRPVWLLDIDGVINACTKKPDRNAWPLDQWCAEKVTADGHEWPVLVALPVVEFIRQVHADGLAEIRWHTTWQREAKALEDAYALPHLPVQDAPEYAKFQLYGGGKGWWKRPAAERVLRDERRALVWTDDDIALDLGRRGSDEIRALGRVLLVSPNERTGLTPKHLRLIAEFLNLPPVRPLEETRVTDEPSTTRIAPDEDTTDPAREPAPRGWVPPVAEHLPAGAFAAAVDGAARLDAYAHSRGGLNLIGHALAELERRGWLATPPVRRRRAVMSAPADDEHATAVDR